MYYIRTSCSRASDDVDDDADDDDDDELGERASCTVIPYIHKGLQLAEEGGGEP